MTLLALVIPFIILLIIGFPITFNLLLSSICYLLFSGYPLTLTCQRMFEDMNSLVLLAVPLFILTGQFVLKGHLLKSLTDFINSSIGHVRGALALVTVRSCLFLGAIVGFALDDIASLDLFFIPIMREEGYRPAFSAAVMATSSLLSQIMYKPASGLIIFFII